MVSEPSESAHCWAGGLPLAPGLRRRHFQCLARGGFDDPRNSYAHAMGWFRERLYVGTTRNIFQLVKIAPDASTDAFHRWPVRVPPGANAATLDQRCQIWCWDPAGGPWRKVFESPQVSAEDDSGLVWRDFGFRNMTVVKTAADDAPALYVTTMSSSKAPGALILRSSDGETFSPITEPGMGNTSVSSFRAFAAFRNRLYAAPAGRGRLWAFGDSVVLECRDPDAREWRPINEPGFGDPSNAGVFELAVFDDHLYAGVGNPFSGIQIWKTDGRGEPPYRWTKVLDQGAGRGKVNQAVMSMCAFQGALYVGTGIRRGGYDREFRTGPAAGEVLRISPDDSWELVVGEERRSEAGDRPSLSGLGPGFGSPFNGYIWCMSVYDGNLYVGTYNSSIFLWWIDPERVPMGAHAHLRRVGAERLVEREAGFDLWRTPDGEHWFEVSRDGFGNPYNYGVRTLLGRDGRGLFVGTANPFAPEVAVRTVGGWEYAPNPRGGLEIWRGLNPREAAREEAAEESPPRLLSPAVGHIGNGDEVEEEWRSRPESLPTPEPWSLAPFSNHGLWTPQTPEPAWAAENLVGRLLSVLPAHPGRLLDVGCGSGGVAAILARRFGVSNVTGVDTSEAAVAGAAAVAPGVRFEVMDGTQLEFPDETFGCVVCIDSAAHFRTRARFLQEAFRVLRPGGWLLLSDELYMRQTEARRADLDARNYLRGPAEYRELLERTGFEEAEVADATREGFLEGSLFALRFAAERFAAEEIEPAVLLQATGRRLSLLLTLRYHVLAAARKPGGGARMDGDDQPSSGAELLRRWETDMTRDQEQEPARAQRMRRSALAHRVLASVTKRQARLHRELATLLDKEADAHVVLDEWAREGAGRQQRGSDGAALRRWGREHLQQTAIARREIAAHKELASRCDARTLWHQTVGTLLMRGSLTLGPDGEPGLDQGVTLEDEES